MYPPYALGGYELVWRSSVRFLQSRGHRVRVLTTDYRDPRLDDSDGYLPDEDVHRQLRWYWHDHDFPKMSLRGRYALERHNADVLDRQLAAYRPDVVAWWAMGGMSLSLIEQVRRRGIPAAGMVCDDWMLYGPDVDPWVRAFQRFRAIGRIAELATNIPTQIDLEKGGRWLFPSETLRRRAVEAGLALDAAVCHQGIDRELFKPAEPHPWRWRLLYLGRIDERKGIDLAVEALAQLPTQATLQIAGAGDEAYAAKLRELSEARRVDDRVNLSGSVPRARVPGTYAKADVLVFPVRWIEPWGLVPLEAMAVGTLVIATGRGGSGEYLRHRENCLIFDLEGGAGGLARAVELLARDASLRERLRAGGFETSDSLREDAYNGAVERLLKDVATCDERS